MGKTALVQELVSLYCFEPDVRDLEQAFLSRGTCLYRLRCQLPTVPVPNAPEDWLFDIAGRQLGAAGLAMEGELAAAARDASGGVLGPAARWRQRGEQQGHA